MGQVNNECNDRSMLLEDIYAYWEPRFPMLDLPLGPCTSFGCRTMTIADFSSTAGCSSLRQLGRPLQSHVATDKVTSPFLLRPKRELPESSTI